MNLSPLLCAIESGLTMSISHLDNDHKEGISCRSSAGHECNFYASENSQIFLTKYLALGFTVDNNNQLGSI